MKVLLAEPPRRAAANFHFPRSPDERKKQIAEISGELCRAVTISDAVKVVGSIAQNY